MINYLRYKLEYIIFKKISNKLSKVLKSYQTTYTLMILKEMVETVKFALGKTGHNIN